MGDSRYRGRRHKRRTRQDRVRELRRRALILICFSFLCIIGLVLLCRRLFFAQPREMVQIQEMDESWEGAPELDVQLLTMNPESRPGIALEKINGIVIHYTANPGTTAQNNRDYFEGLKDSHETQASSHFVIGMDGEIIQCIPSTEIAYASNDRNNDTLSIECCHPDESGKFTDATYQSLVQLTAWLCKRFDVDPADGVIRHYDVTGKECPRYFVEHEDAWETFLGDVQVRCSEI